MEQRTRTLAFALAAPALAAPWIQLWGDDIGLAMLLLGLALGAAGAVLSLRFYPIRMLFSAPAGTAEEVGDELRSLLPIGAVIAGAVTASAVVAAVTGSLGGRLRPASLVAAPIVLLVSVICLLLGLCAGLILLVPLVTLVVELTSRRRADWLLVAGSVLLLLVAAFAIAISIAVPGSSTGPRPGAIGLTLVLLFTVVLPSPDDVGSLPALWTARVALLALIGAVVWVVMAQPARRRR